MDNLDSAADGKPPCFFFDNPARQARVTELLTRWRQLRVAHTNAPATPGPAEEPHAESAETAGPEPHAEGAEQPLTSNP